MYYSKLRLDFNPFVDLPTKYYHLDNTEKLTVWNKYIDTNDLNNSTRDWFIKNNLFLKSCIIITYLPNSSCPIHVDGNNTDEYDYRQFTAINFTMGGRGSIQWFKPTGETPTDVFHTEIAKSPIIKYDEATSELADTHAGTDPAVVRVDMPHRGVNMSNQTRYSITLRWLPKLTWEQAQEKFKPFFL